MMNVSKRLLSEVLGEEYSLNKFPDGYSINYKTTLVLSKYSGVEFINIYELAHKCKEWALKSGYILHSSLSTFTVMNKQEGISYYGNGFDTEPEAIFKATSYIMEQLKQKD